MCLYDPVVETSQVQLDMQEQQLEHLAAKHLKIHPSAYSACNEADALVVCTEWDEFTTLDFERIYADMRKPACVFDGRLILNAERLRDIGFDVFTIGKSQ